MNIKRLVFASLLLALPLTPTGWTGMSCPKAQTPIYQSLAATEAGVIAANGAYLDGVVSGIIPTNGVPVVEAAFNDMQLALHTAAVSTSGGSAALTPPAVFLKASAFTNTITANSMKH